MNPNETNEQFNTNNADPNALTSEIMDELFTYVPDLEVEPKEHEESSSAI